MYFEVYQSPNNKQWYWRLKAANHEPIATGGEGYSEKRGALHAVELVKGTNASTPVKEI